MKPSKLLKRVKQLIAADGDHCTSCGKAFQHLGTTYVCEGNGDIAIVGECCVGKFKKVLGGSIYLKPIRESGKQYH
jgi:hypothetical protein